MMSDILDKSAREAIAAFNAVNDAVREANENSQYLARPRLANDVDLSKYDPSCARCNNGVIRWIQPDINHDNSDIIEPPKPPNSAKRSVKRKYERDIKRYKRAIKKRQSETTPPIPVVCNCVVRGGGIKRQDKLDRMITNARSRNN
jgi:hypothetical protein